MNAVEIEAAISDLALQPFDWETFPFAFLQAFGNKETTLKRLRSGASNKSDLGGVLQTSNIHIAVAPLGEVSKTLAALKDSPATSRAKARFILATDGESLEAEEIETGETIACAYPDFPDHFGFFLPLAGITTVKQIRDSSFDIRATSRLNRLYVELLKDNPDWGSAAQRHEMNHLMARLIFCFFAEDTDIFHGSGLFTATIEQMSARDSSNTHEVISEIFRAMNTKTAERTAGNFRPWADQFPYVNGGLFSGSLAVPHFSKIARSYLLHIGKLDWTQINPDIFGSMIQAVADDEERGELGMHYTSVPNILKVLNPLFLDELRGQLEKAGKSERMLLNLRKRLARIRVFDPACGSGNFLVIAYKQMREIENTLNERRGEAGRKSDIPLTNFRGIEIRDFSAEVARLALIIAEYQCDVRYLGQKEALAEFLPLNTQNWITCGNALRLDWLSLMDADRTGVKLLADDLFQTPLVQAQIDFENEGGETYICGNPPYLGSTWQTREQKADLEAIFEGRTQSWKSLDYVAGWFMKAADFGWHANAIAAFVATNSICQGQQVPILWPLIFATGHEIAFAHTSFKWANLASHNAGVTVAIIGMARNAPKPRQMFSLGPDGVTLVRDSEYINAYLISGPDVVVSKTTFPLDSQLAEMSFGNKPVDGGHLLLTTDEVTALRLTEEQQHFIRRIYGSAEFIRGLQRYCLWIEDRHLDEALRLMPIRQRIDAVRAMRQESPKQATIESAAKAHKFGEVRQTGAETVIIIPSVSSEATIVSNLAFALYDAPLWNMALIASRLHLVWIATVCGKLETRYRYSNTLGWNTFPVPALTEKNKADLTRCAETSCSPARRTSRPPSPTSTIPDACPPICAPRMSATTRCWSASTSAAASRTTPSGWRKLFELYTKMTADIAKAKLATKSTRSRQA
jgi:hypothetical protein